MNVLEQPDQSQIQSGFAGPVPLLLLVLCQVFHALEMRVVLMWARSSLLQRFITIAAFECFWARAEPGGISFVGCPSILSAFRNACDP